MDGVTRSTVLQLSVMQPCHLKGLDHVRNDVSDGINDTKMKMIFVKQ